MSREQQEIICQVEHSITPGKAFQNKAEVMQYLDNLIGGDWWADENLPLLSVQVEVRHQLRKFLGVAMYPDGMLLAPKGLTEGVVLHELAHLLTPEHKDHGREFAWTYLMLVRQQMGFFAWAEMSQGIKKSNLFG